MWSEWGYQEILTEDGTPSLKSAASPDAEMMHHRGGALAESRLIYGRLIRPALASSAEARFLSLGLGLGYNEALIAEEALAQGRSWRCVSYESDPRLRSAFRDFVEGRPLPPQVRATYERIFKSLRDPESTLRELASALEEGRWVLEPALSEVTRPPFLINAYLWDAFSRKTSPGLWSEPFLTEFLKTWSCPEWSGLSTYACIGNLKRALGAAGFRYEVREGFQGKRHSTYASRERIL